MNTTDQHLARIGQLIAAGARLYFWDGQPSIPLQAVAWIDGKGLLYAERGTVDQSGVHLQEAHQLTNDGSTVIEEATEFDLLTAGGDLIATILPERGDQALPELPPSWARFWADEVENAKGGA